jgi:ABC-type polysaccharide/polyol phosphate transport system ATPase subunit
MRSPSAGEAPVVIEVRGVRKAFRIPEHRIDSFKERATHPFTRVEYRQLQVLRDISFDVRKGEFFGVVGRNGSGKSSLLKILAGIYRADAGRIRMAGRVAPFIELGVGFNPELTGRENAVLNGVLMGLTKREARRRVDAIFDFAGLHDFAELRLKNYSSGMLIRLAFAVMVQADADVMLIDEVLAVGDAAFAQKCMDVFHERRRAGKTIVLVTHDMTAVQTLCHRAMLVHDGALQYLGDPEETARRYFRLNFAPDEDGDEAAPKPTAIPDINARVLHARLEDEAGAPTENVEQGKPLILDVELEARRELERPLLAIQVLNADGMIVFAFSRELGGTRDGRVVSGQRLRLSGRIENPLVPGRYSIDCWVRRDGQAGDMAVQGLRLLDFVVFGTAPRAGLVSARADVTAVAE